jgi:hypothetical protein
LQNGAPLAGRPLPAPSRAQRVLCVQGGKLKNLRRVRWVRARSPERTPIKPETRFRRSPPVGLPEVTSQRFERRAGLGQGRGRALSAGCPVTRAAGRRPRPLRGAPGGQGHRSIPFRVTVCASRIRTSQPSSRAPGLEDRDPLPLSPLPVSALTDSRPVGAASAPLSCGLRGAADSGARRRAGAHYHSSDYWARRTQPELALRAGLAPIPRGGCAPGPVAGKAQGCRPGSGWRPLGLAPCLAAPPSS